MHRRYPATVQATRTARLDAVREMERLGLAQGTVANGALIVGEAAANAFRWSGGTSFTVGVRRVGAGAAIRIADNGKGADLGRILSDEHAGRLVADASSLHQGLVLMEGHAAVCRLRRRSVFVVVGVLK